MKRQAQDDANRLGAVVKRKARNGGKESGHGDPSQRQRGRG